MSVTKADLRGAILKHLGNTQTSNVIGTINDGTRRDLFNRISEQSSQDLELADKRVMGVVRELIRQGLAYMDYNAKDRLVHLTDAGRAAAHDEEVNPDNPDRYLERLYALVPEATDVVQQYVKEAIDCFNATCYFASVVMLGVASEAAFLEMAGSFAKWKGLTDPERQKFAGVLDSRRSCSGKFDAFRRKLSPKRKDLGELSDCMDIYLDAIFTLIRIYRNDSGHPTGKRIIREDAHTNLTVFPFYLQRLYRLKAFFDSNQVTT